MCITGTVSLNAVLFVPVLSSTCLFLTNTFQVVFALLAQVVICYLLSCHLWVEKKKYLSDEYYLLELLLMAVL